MRAGALGIVASFAVVGLAVVVLASRCGLDANAEGEILSRLKATEREGLSLSIPGASVPLVSQRHFYDRITLSVDYAAGTASAVATLDFLGRFGQTQVSSLGLERIRFRYRDGAWEPEGSLAPLLTTAVARLEERRRALEAGDERRLIALRGSEPGTSPEDAALRRVLSVSARTYRVKAWYLRSEREGFTVSEAYRLTGDLPERPVDEEGLRSLGLVRRGQEFFFWPALM